MSGGTVDLTIKGIVASGLIVESGGTVDANGNIQLENTVISGGLVDLQSAKASAIGTLTFEGAGTFQVDDNTTSAGFGNPAVIAGFGAGDAVDVTFIDSGATLTSAVVDGNTVETITGNNTSSGDSTSESFTFAGTYAAGFFNLSPDSASGVMITATGTPCYCPGTLILTDRGEVAVETLQIGDLVVTHAGAMRPIHWIGHRAYNGRFAAGQKQILPVRIAAGALADGVPRRDLMVSPLHAMFIDGMLIPASALVNGASIVQLEAGGERRVFPRRAGKPRRDPGRGRARRDVRRR